MAKIVFGIIPLLFLAVAGLTSDESSTRRQIVHEIQTQNIAFENLRELTSMGPRISGSQGAENAVKWAQSKMASYGLDRVWLQPVMVPRWIRGDREKARATAGDEIIDLHVAALGNSPGTTGLEAEVVEVKSLKQVEQLGPQVRGKIVFYNRPMDSTLSDTFEAYGRAADQRTRGPAKAAQFGAVAVLVRSLTTRIDDFPHTGVTVYDRLKIPAAAISTKDADLLASRLSRGLVKVQLQLSAQYIGMVPSFNVIGEIRGTEKPDEVVVFGGHLDSWDLAACAQDDGGAVAQTLDVLRAFKATGTRPKRTVRGVLFMAEEFGGYGGEEYARQAAKAKETHIAAIESDRGVFAVEGFSVNGTSEKLQRLQSFSRELGEVGAGNIIEGEGGTDIDPLTELGVPAVGLLSNSTHYFDYHHSARDNIDAVSATDLKNGAAALASLVFLISERGL